MEQHHYGCSWAKVDLSSLAKKFILRKAFPGHSLGIQTPKLRKGMSGTLKINRKYQPRGAYFGCWTWTGCNETKEMLFSSTNGPMSGTPPKKKHKHLKKITPMTFSVMTSTNFQFPLCWPNLSHDQRLSKTAMFDSSKVTSKKDP